LVAASDLSLVLTDEHLERTFKMIDTDNSGKLSS
jgi:Ca2+-binding EF-hand superfamily protein